MSFGNEETGRWTELEAENAALREERVRRLEEGLRKEGHMVGGVWHLKICAVYNLELCSPSCKAIRALLAEAGQAVEKGEGQ